MGEVHLFPKPNPFIFSTANLLKDQTEYILLYDQNRRMIHWLFQVILHQLMSWYNPVDTILHSFTGWHAGSRQVTPWVHCNSAGLFSTVFVVAHFYSWIVSNGASSPDCSLFTNSYFFWKKQTTLDYLFFFHLSKGTALAPWVFSTVLNTTLSSFLSLDFCTCCVLYMKCFELDKCISSYFLSFRCQLRCHVFYLKEQSFLTLWVLFCPLPGHSVSSGIIISAFLNWSRQGKITTWKLWY